MGIGVNRDQNPCYGRLAGIVGGQVEAVGAGVDLEKAAIQPRVSDDAIDVDLVARPFEQEPPGGMPQNIEIPVVHRAHDPLGLLLAVETEP